jgi:hypothetical protein
MKFDRSRDYRIAYPILAIIIILLAITLPNLDSYLTIIFLLATLLVGMYGAIRGKGSVNKIDNTLELHPGVVRLILGGFTLILAIIAASIQAPEQSIMSIFGIAGELLGIAVPGLVSSPSSSEPSPP